MANSPSHRFGQDLGKLLENVVLNHILQPRLEAFAQAKNFYLDWQKARPVRPGKKVTWYDKYGNKHDLDFVIEIGGTDHVRGQPVAFIEAAWRRYTKHSKNKAQEIQGALLPIIELHHLSAPFYGVVLAGEFTKPALEQLRNNNFSVLYIPYQDVVNAFTCVGFDIAFHEATPEVHYDAAIEKLANLTDADKDAIRQALTTISKVETDKFIQSLQAALERFIIQVIVIPLFGSQLKFTTVEDALLILKGVNKTSASGSLQKIEIIVDYNNGATIRGSFVDEEGAIDFLKKL